MEHWPKWIRLRIAQSPCYSHSRDAVSVEIFLATPSRTGASNLHVLDRKLVVVRQLFAARYRPLREDDDMLAPGTVVDYLRVAVRLARVIDEACRIAGQSRVHDLRITQPEHVAADVPTCRPAALVQLLTTIGQHWPDYFAGVLDHHLTVGNIAPSEQAAVVYVRSEDGNGLLRWRSQLAEPHRHRHVDGSGYGRCMTSGNKNYRGLTCKSTRFKRLQAIWQALEMISHKVICYPTKANINLAITQSKQVLNFSLKGLVS